MSYEYWCMFPVAMLVATAAMASGVEGATFFTPIFLLALGLPVEVAIGTGLITEVFGFASGLVAYSRKRLIDYKLGRNLLVMTIPLALLGTWMAGWVAPLILKVILGMGLFAVALSFLRTPEHEEVGRMDNAIDEEYGGEKAETSLVTAEDEEILYKVCNPNEGRLIAGTGALFMGLISTGLGEMNAYFLLQRCRVPSKVSVATSVFVVAVTALIAASGHFYKFIQAGGEVLDTVLSLVMFMVPGVIIGGQIGSLAILFILIAILTLGDVIF